jgi:hypothetical protein
MAVISSFVALVMFVLLMIATIINIKLQTKNKDLIGHCAKLYCDLTNKAIYINKLKKRFEWNVKDGWVK